MKVVSTSDGPIWSRYSIALTCPTRSYFQRTLSKERWGQSWDERYRSSTEEKEWGDEKGQEKGRRRKKTGDRFKRSRVLPFCGRSGGSTSKNKWGLPGITGTLERSAYYRYCCPELATVLSGVTFFYNSANESCAKFFKSSCSWRKVHPLLK